MADAGICYCGNYGGGKHTKSARCPESVGELRARIAQLEDDNKQLQFMLTQVNDSAQANCLSVLKLQAENQRLRADAERLIDGLVEMEREGALDGCFMHGPEGMLDGQACVWSFIGERIQDYHKKLDSARGVKADQAGEK